jgi:hypothetical protein
MPARRTILLAACGLLSLCRLVWADESTAQVSLDNLAPYTSPVVAWSDRHSNVALAWPRPEEPGLQCLVSIIGWGGPQITQEFLRWNLAENGKQLALSLKSRNFRPDKVVETDAADGLELRVTAAWPARNALALEIAVTNQTAKPRVIKLGFDYPGKGRKPDWKGPCPVGEFFALESEPQGCWSTIYTHTEHGLNTLWVSGFVAGMTQGTPLNLVCLADLSPRELRLQPNGTARLTIPFGLGGYRGRAREALDEAAAKIAKGWTSAEETARWLEIFRKAPPLAARYRGQEKYERMYAHAIAALSSLCIRGEGGYTGTKRIPYTTKCGLAMPFFWDTSFTCVGLREFDPLLAQEAILCFTENAGPRGSLPGTLCDSHRAGEGQAPIMGWAAWLIYQRGHDKQWLRRVYPVLAGNHRFWLKYHCTPRGLCQFFNAGQIADNDARFDPIQGNNANQSLLGMLESPDVNAFLVTDARSLAKMADELGLADEARAWREKADALAKRIVDTMFFPEEAMFYDVKTGTHEKLSGVKSPNMFLPLWAAVPLKRDQVKAIVEGHMLNPKEFYRELPFPSLSYDNPNYDPQGYWRGRIWPHVVYWMIQTLWRQGYEKEAEQTAARLMKMYEKSPWQFENFESATGAGIGQPDYNWGCATAIELLLERYKEPMP